MDVENPGKIDLKKTETFRRWKRSNEQLHSDILSVAIRETIEQDRIETNEEGSNDHNDDIETGQVTEEESDSESEASVADNEGEASVADNESEASIIDNESEALVIDNESEALVIENQGGQEDLNEGMLAAQQADDLVNEMILDEELRALLNIEPEDDEGIELNIFNGQI